LASVITGVTLQYDATVDAFRLEKSDKEELEKFICAVKLTKTNMNDEIIQPKNRNLEDDGKRIHRY
jgi:hypothetical protein